MIITWKADLGRVLGIFEGGMARVRNMRPVLLGRVAQIMRQMTERNFTSTGALATPEWPPLTPRVALRPRIAVLRVTDGLFTSLTRPGGDAIMEVEADNRTLRYGSRLRRHRFHQLGTVNMPARQPIPNPVPPATLRALREAIRQWVVFGKSGEAAA